MIGACVLLLVLGLDTRISRLDGVLLFTLMVAYTVFLVLQSRKQSLASQADYAAEIPLAEQGAWDAGLPAQLGLIVVGLILLVLGSEWLVTAAVAFAKAMGVSDLIIGLTIVAAGTSMPEVATSIAAALNGERDIAVGNVVGSNTFNILGCLGITGLMSGESGLSIAPSVLAFDVWVLIAVALACLPVFMSGKEIARWEGAVFLGYYIAYVSYLILAAQAHDVLGQFSAVMMSFVVPLTVVTLIVVMLKRQASSASDSA
jgi:cation:H+ antiporter